MRRAIDETERRREKQHQYNLDNNITPTGVIRKITDVMNIGTRTTNTQLQDKVAEDNAKYTADSKVLSTREIDVKIGELEENMYKLAQNLEFEQAAAVRDEISQLRILQLSS